jgi:hypothetical protein
VLLARAANAFALPDLMVPPCSVRFAAFEVTLIPVVYRSRLPPSTYVPAVKVPLLICVSL